MTTPVSGPGALSRRTDTGPTQRLATLPDAEYGENATYQDLQRGAGLAQSQGGDAVQGMAQGNPAAANVIPFGAPSGDPNQPITSGIDLGAGPNAASLGMSDQRGEDDKRMLMALPALEFFANQEGSSWYMRNIVRRLKANL